MRTASGLSSFWLALWAAVAVAGCTAVTSGTGPSSRSKASLAVLPQFPEAVGFRTAADVHHVIFKLFSASGSAELYVENSEKDVARGDLGGGVAFTGLEAAKYRVRAYVYKTAGSADADKISVDSRSFLDLTAEEGGSRNIVPMTIQLAVFDGRATGSAAIADGAFTTIGAPTLGFQLTAVTTLAGTNSAAGFADGQGQAARFDQPRELAADAAGNLFIADSANRRIRKVTPDGLVSTHAGSGASGFSDGATSDATFTSPYGIAVDGAGSVYVSDGEAIRKISPGGVVSTFAGSPAASGSADGATDSARFDAPRGLAVDGAGNVYVAEFQGARVRKITPAGDVSTLAGGKSGTFTDGATSDAVFVRPNAVAVDGAGNVYVAEQSNRIRKISGGFVTTLAGSGVAGHLDGATSSAKFPNVLGITVDSQTNVYIVDANSRVRVVTATGLVRTVAGGNGAGFNDGTGSLARFNNPAGIRVGPGDTLFVTDAGNRLIRKIVP